MVRAEGISYSVGRVKILSGLDMVFPTGEFSMILGPNGSGKSSFLKIFSGSTTQYGGNIHYGDSNIRTLSKAGLAKYRAVMSQHADINFPLTVKEVVMMGRYPHFSVKPSIKDIDTCEEVMSRMQLSSLGERNYTTLSGGEKQRVQFARVLAQVWHPQQGVQRYLFLDEPVASLDINYQHLFLQFAKEMVDDNTTVVAIMHDINLSTQYGDRLFFLKEGRLIAEGRPRTIITEDIIERTFSVRTAIINNPLTNLPLVLYQNRQA